MTILADEVQAVEVEGYVTLTDEQANQIGMLKAARKNTKAWASQRDVLTAKIKDILHGAQGAVYNGHVVAEIKNRAGQRKVDLDLLKAKHPAAYAECVTEGKQQTVLDIR